MEPKTKLFLKLFLFTGTVFGIGMALFQSVWMNGINIGTTLFPAAFFGVFMGLLLPILQKDNSKNKSEDE